MTKPKRIELTQDELKKVLNYNPLTGVFRWKISTNSRSQVGNIAGGLKPSGRWEIMYDYRAYKAHRLAWLYVYGEISEELFIDHIDGNPSNNQISNLRTCTAAENQKNRKISKNNTSGFKGVHLEKSVNKYMVSIRNPETGKHEHYHGFTTLEEASIFYEAKAVVYNGEFYRDTTKERGHIEKEKTNSDL